MGIINLSHDSFYENDTKSPIKDILYKVKDLSTMVLTSLILEEPQQDQVQNCQALKKN